MIERGFAMTQGAGRAVGAMAAVAVAFAAGCGGEETAVPATAGPGPTTSSTTSAPSTSTTMPSPPTSSRPTAPPTVFEGVVVAQGQASIEQEPSWWWVVDLDAGAEIEESSRVRVELANDDDVRCGDQQHHVPSYRIDEGTALSFEVAPIAPGPAPDFWMIEGDESFESAPAVRGESFRTDCPEGADAAAAELAAQRRTWDERGPASYEFAMTWHIFNNSYGDYRIGVDDGVAVSVVKDGTTRLDPRLLHDQLPLTVDELFDELARRVSADRFDATYDPALGFPVDVMVDEMLDSVDDELDVRITDLVAGSPAPVVERPPSIGQRLEGTAFYWTSTSPDGVSLWLYVDVAGGLTVDGSSRLSVQVPVTEVRCGDEQRPIETLESLADGPATVSFELAALTGEPPPQAEPTERQGPAVTGRQLHIPTCPPTTEDRLADLAAARARWEAAGVDDYEMDVMWSPLGQAETRHRVTVVDGSTVSVVTLDEFDQAGAAETDPAVLAALPGTVEAWFDWLASTIPVEDLEVYYDPSDGHPGGAFGGSTSFDLNFRTSSGG